MTEPYGDLVDTWVKAAICSAPTSFDDVVCHLPGIYPTDAQASLNRLVRAGQISTEDYRRATQRRPVPAQAPRAMGLSIPHPLDFDWRFSDAGLDTVLRVIGEVAGDGGLICLGAPSIVRRMQLEGDPRAALLLDANPRPVEVINATPGMQQAQTCRLGTDPLPGTSAPVVVIDPPWYPEHFEVFLWAAAHLVEAKGHVIVSFPAAGTRPDVTNERDQALAWAASLGLELQEIRRNLVGYRSPPFERAALAAVELDDLPGDWRRGDLLILQQVKPPDTGAEPVSLGEPEWIPIIASPTQIRVRIATRKARVDPRLITVVKGDVLPTVSRRDNRRALVDVWTANQRVYGCADTGSLAAIAEAIAANTPPVRYVESTVGRELGGDERAYVSAASRQLYKLIEKETSDLRRYRWLDEA